MRTRIIAAAGFSATALIAAAAFAPMAVASSNGGGGAAKHVSPLASSMAHGTAAGQPGAIDARRGKCGTKFGPELPSPDGVIAWNDTSGTTFDEAGAADFTCTKATTVNKVNVYGYGGQATETFHVTFYANDPTGTLNEPNDNAVICDYPSITAAAGGVYPTRVKSSLVLPSSCQLPAGTSWVAVQNYDAAAPWYWEMQDTQSGSYGPDWRDVHDVFGSGCTTFDSGGGGEDRYLVDCLGYTYADWMMKLK